MSDLFGPGAGPRHQAGGARGAVFGEEDVGLDVFEPAIGADGDAGFGERETGDNEAEDLAVFDGRSGGGSAKGVEGEALGAGGAGGPARPRRGGR